MHWLVVQMSVWEHQFGTPLLDTLALDPLQHASNCQASGLRVLDPDPNFRLEHHTVLRGHLPGRERRAAGHSTLDQRRLRHPLRCWNALQVGGAGFPLLLFLCLDGPWLCHRHGVAHQRRIRRFGQFSQSVSAALSAYVESTKTSPSHFSLAGHEGNLIHTIIHISSTVPFLFLLKKKKRK